MSTNRTHHTLSLAIGSVVLVVSAVVWARQANEILADKQPAEGDVYTAQSEVKVSSTVAGDLVAAGRRVTVDGTVSGDVIAAAQHIEIRSDVRDDVRTAGQHIRVSAPVSGHMVAAGQTVTVEQSIGDWARLTGSTVEVRGNVGSDLQVSAKKITIDAEVAGNAELAGDELKLGPNTVIRGDVRWRSRNEAEISPDAQIDGEFIEEQPPGLVEELTDASTYTLPLSTIVAVTVLSLLFPRPLRASADRVANRPVKSLLLGLAVLIALPALALLLFSTGVGGWLGFAVILIFLLTLLLGWLTGLFATSDWVLHKFRQQPAMWQSLVAILVTVIAVSLVGKIPWLGLIFVMAILLLGIGALCWNSWTALREFKHHKAQPSP